MTHITSKQQKMTSRRAVSPIIATLLLVAITVVGGSIIFVFTQGFFSASQVSGAPTIESLKFTGYDASDGTLLNHDGTTLTAVTNTEGGGLLIGDDVLVYLQNNSVGKVTLGEVRFAGAVYNYTADPIVPGEYRLLTIGPGTYLSTSSAELQPGQRLTIVLNLSENIKNGRDAQFKVTTTNGAVFLGTVMIGQQSG